MMVGSKLECLISTTYEIEMLKLCTVDSLEFTLPIMELLSKFAFKGEEKAFHISLLCQPVDKERREKLSSLLTCRVTYQCCYCPIVFFLLFTLPFST